MTAAATHSSSGQARQPDETAGRTPRVTGEDQLQLGAELMGQRRFAEALECFRRAHALGARGFLVDFGLGSALLDTGQDAAAIVELERAAALEPRHIGVLQNLAQGAVPPRPRGRGGRRLPCGARGERRLPPSLRPRHGDPRSSFRHARRRSRGAPRLRRERSALAALPLLRGTQPGSPPRRLPLVVLPFGQLDEAGLGPRQRARPHRLRSPPPLGRDGGGMRGRRIPAGSPRHVRGHPGTRQRTGRRAHRRRRARCPRRPQRLQRAPPATRRRLPPGPRRRGDGSTTSPRPG